MTPDDEERLALMRKFIAGHRRKEVLSAEERRRYEELWGQKPYVPLAVVQALMKDAFPDWDDAVHHSSES